MLKEFKGVTNFYGNGSAYVTEGDRVQLLKKHNFEASSLRKTGDDMWVTSGVIVALGVECEPWQALRQLRAVAARIEEEMAQDGTGLCPHCGEQLGKCTSNETGTRRSRPKESRRSRDH